MDVAVINLFGTILWVSSVKPGIDRAKVIGSKCWEWQRTPSDCIAVRQAFAMSTIQNGELSIVVSGGTESRWYNHRLTFERVTDIVVCSWHDMPEQSLTTREREVLLAICNDLSPHEICERLGIKSNTFDTYRSILRRKLGVQGTAGMVRWAIIHGLFSP